MNYAERELKRLADFLLERHPQEVEGGNFNGDEGAVDVAVRLLSDGGRFWVLGMCLSLLASSVEVGYEKVNFIDCFYDADINCLRARRSNASYRFYDEASYLENKD